ncbi:hypothetical protein CN426_10695 [Bacillus thuringiensis]|nr:hypothetical protein CN426_10695 [Bacillus thuringiensis]
MGNERKGKLIFEESYYSNTFTTNKFREQNFALSEDQTEGLRNFTHTYYHSLIFRNQITEHNFVLSSYGVGNGRDYIPSQF